MHIYCIGRGRPTVVVTGAGASFDWGLVQPEVAKFTRVCTFDHSGVGWSDPGPRDTCLLRVNEIHAALKKLRISGPYVLVGHSLGALVARLYAARFEQEVAGLVIVDHASTKPIAFRSPVAGPAAGSVRLPMKPDPNRGFEKLPEPYYKLHLWAFAALICCSHEPECSDGKRVRGGRCDRDAEPDGSVGKQAVYCTQHRCERIFA